MMGDSGESSQSHWQATPPPKRKRTCKATSSQFEELVRQLEARPFLATRRFTGLQGKENFDVGWREVAQELNQIRNGAVKTADQWITVWRDLKSRCTSKAAKFNKQRVETGNRDINALPLNDLEKRVVSLVGVEYTIGTSCPDAMPEEDAVQRDLEAGVVLDTHYIDLSHSGPSNNAVAVESMSYILEDEESVIIDSEIPPLEIQNNQPALASADASMSNSQSIQSTSQQALLITPTPRESGQQSQPRRNRVLNPRRSIADQQNTARADFLAVAESNAYAMKVMADAMKMQAEAAKMQAEAAKTQAEAMMLLATAANKLCVVLENKK